MLLYQIFLQSFAIIALGFFAFSFHTKTRSKILTFQLLSLVAYEIHFLLLSAYTGAVLIVLNALITIALIFKTKFALFRKKFFLILAFVALAIGTFFSWQAYYSLFAFLGVSLITLSKWQEHTKKIRSIVS